LLWLLFRFDQLLPLTLLSWPFGPLAATYNQKKEIEYGK
jgi:hypothetical protein